MEAIALIPTDDLADLPIKSLELPSKTASKLKPLGARTVRELFLHTPDELVALGLGAPELQELAEAARDFGVEWVVPERLHAAVVAAPKPPAPKAPKRASTPRPAAALPADLLEAFSGPCAPLVLDAGDLAFFDGCVDATGRHFQTPPPSARHLRLVRRLGLLRDLTIGGQERVFLVGLIDLSGYPLSRLDGLQVFLGHMGNLVADALLRSGIKARAQSLSGCAVQLTLVAKDLPRARKLVEAHARWIGSEPPFGDVPAPLRAIADAGLAAFAGASER